MSDNTNQEGVQGNRQSCLAGIVGLILIGTFFVSCVHVMIAIIMGSPAPTIYEDVRYAEISLAVQPFKQTIIEEIRAINAVNEGRDAVKAGFCFPEEEKILLLDLPLGHQYRIAPENSLLKEGHIPSAVPPRYVLVFDLREQSARFKYRGSLSSGWKEKKICYAVQIYDLETEMKYPAGEKCTDYRAVESIDKIEKQDRARQTVFDLLKPYEIIDRGRLDEYRISYY